MSVKQTRDTARDGVEPDAARPALSDEGVDLTLIRMMCEKSYAERLRWLNDAANGVLRLRRARRVT